MKGFDNIVTEFLAIVVAINVVVIIAWLVLS